MKLEWLPLLLCLNFTVIPAAIDSEVEVVAQLANQTLWALQDFFKGCDSFPQYQEDGSLKCFPTNAKSNYGKLSVVVMDRNGNIIDSMNSTKSKSPYLKDDSKVVLMVHSLGESACSSNMQRLTKAIYAKDPKKLVLIADYSKLSCKSYKMSLLSIPSFCSDIGEISQLRTEMALLTKKMQLGRKQTDSRFIGLILSLIISAISIGSMVADVVTVAQSVKDPSTEPPLINGTRSRSHNTKPRTITTLLNPPNLAQMFPNYEGVFDLNYSGFVGTMQTSDILGNPEKKLGNVNVYSNGGRMQPGCYTDESDIFQLGSAIVCSSQRAVDMYINTMKSKTKNDYKARACQCWDVYRKGKCADRLSNYAGDNVIVEKAATNGFRYFTRTLKTGGPMGDTANLRNYKDDFVYLHDDTCKNEDSLPRKPIIV